MAEQWKPGTWTAQPEAVVHFKGSKSEWRNTPDRTGLGVFQGLLTKEAQHMGKAQDRWCVLNNELLIYFESEANCLDPNAGPKGLLNLRRVDSVVVRGHVFTVFFDSDSGVSPRVFDAKTEKEATRWCKNIERRLQWIQSVSSQQLAGGIVKKKSSVNTTTSYKQKARDKITFRCFSIERVSKKVKLHMRELLIDKLGSTPTLSMRDSSENGNGQTSGGAGGGSDFNLATLALITHIVRCNISTDARMFFSTEGGARQAITATSQEYRFPDAASRDNFCYSLHLLQNKIRVFEEGEVLADTNQLDFQVNTQLLGR